VNRETLHTRKKSRRNTFVNHFVQELSAAEDVSEISTIVDEVVVAVAVVVLGVVAVAVGGVDVTATVEAFEFTVENVVAVVRMRVAPPAALGPARTANETGWPLCRAADTCDSKAFC
jgi:hypothetical protein